MEIGFIGLGNMGGPIAHNLLKAGQDVTVWNRSAARAARLVEAGARQAATPAEAATGDVVFTMLANDAAVEAVTFGADGILASAARPIHVSLSTIGVALAERLAKTHAEAGRGFVSAPVFGRPAAAEAGTLFVVAAGAPEALAVCAPLFEAIGQRTFVVGEAPGGGECDQTLRQLHDHGGGRIAGRGHDSGGQERRREGGSARRADQ